MHPLGCGLNQGQSQGSSERILTRENRLTSQLHFAVAWLLSIIIFLDQELSIHLVVLRLSDVVVGATSSKNLKLRHFKSDGDKSSQEC